MMLEIERSFSTSSKLISVVDEMHNALPRCNLGYVTKTSQNIDALHCQRTYEARINLQAKLVQAQKGRTPGAMPMSGSP